MAQGPKADSQLELISHPPAEQPIPMPTAVPGSPAHETGLGPVDDKVERYVSLLGSQFGKDRWPRLGMAIMAGYLILATFIMFEREDFVNVVPSRSEPG